MVPLTIRELKAIQFEPADIGALPLFVAAIGPVHLGELLPRISSPADDPVGLATIRDKSIKSLWMNRKLSPSLCHISDGCSCRIREIGRTDRRKR